MYLYGASGHAKVIIDILKSKNIKLKGLIDDNPSLNSMLGYNVFHTAEGLSPIIISIGNNNVRKNIAQSLKCEFAIAIDKSAIISNSATIQQGSVIMQGAIIQSYVIIGKHCIINTGASVDHECRIGDYVHISPHATLCGNVEVGECTQIGVGAVVIPGIKIGLNCIIGAGSVVIKDIPNNVVVVGNPAKIIKTFL